MVYYEFLGSNYLTIFLKYLLQTIKCLHTLLKEEPEVVFVMSLPVIAYCAWGIIAFAVGIEGCFITKISSRWLDEHRIYTNYGLHRDMIFSVISGVVGVLIWGVLGWLFGNFVDLVIRQRHYLQNPFEWMMSHKAETLASIAAIILAIILLFILNKKVAALRFGKKRVNFKRRVM